MLTEKLQENLFKLVYALESLNKQGYFDSLIKFAHMYHNYEFCINAEIKTLEKDIIYENSDIVKIAENIINRKDIDTSEFESNQDSYETVNIAKINNKGFTLFPEDDPKLIDSELKKRYDEYIDPLYRFIKLLRNMEEQERNETIKLLEEKINESLPSAVGNEPVKEQHNENKEINGYLILDLSTFYFLNEVAVRSFWPGIWGDYVQIMQEVNQLTDQYDEIVEIGDIENIDVFDLDLEKTGDGLFVIEHLFDISKIKFFIEARLYYEGQVFNERIYGMLYGNLINKNLRGFYNGNYCPIGKSDFLSSLPYSPDVKITIDMLVKCVDSLPPELQEGFVKLVCRKFKEKGMTGEIEITEKLYEEMLFTNKEILEMKKKYEEGQQRNEAGLIQILKLISPNDIPSFIKNLNLEHHDRYLIILKDIIMIRIPITNEETALYKHIMTDLGTLVGNILTSIHYGGDSYKKDITISNLHRFDSFLQKLNEGDKEFMKRYSIECGITFNDIRHPDKKITHDEICGFIKKSNQVIEIALKYKN